MQVDSSSRSSSRSSSSVCCIEGMSVAQSLAYLADVCDILYKLHVDEKNRGVLMILSFDLFHKVGGLSALLRSLHYGAACNVAVSALLATRVCTCCNPVAALQASSKASSPCHPKFVGERVSVEGRLGCGRSSGNSGCGEEKRGKIGKAALHTTLLLRTCGA
ncbi:uba ts-n domain-containing protein [Cyclospora cayetanensis]|uniref:Uba ts-n domain-containing protein n=1 Tax=Cyclospora cayetanensis TaxID=88456 RepID=A0A1D3CXE3_9EIME|nr:uba ts-n domain-containing protein [Cyclospora cayetanensis]